ncbi:hypothetical protein Tco_0948518 [Tanacetum coccineum]
MVDAYESDKLILDTYGDTVLFKRRQDDEDKDKEPSAGSNRGSKRKRVGKEPEPTSAPKEKTSKTIGKSTEGYKYHHEFADKSVQAEEPMHTAKYLEEPAHQEFVTEDTEDKPDEETSQLPDCTLALKEDTRESFNELMDTPLDFSAFVMNRHKVDTLTLELLAGLTFELIKVSCKSLQYPHDLCKPLPLIPNSQGRQVIPFDHVINNDLVYLSGGISSRTYTTSVTKTKAADYWHIKWIEDLVPNIMWNWIIVRRDDDKLYKFKEGDFNRLRIQDIEDMRLLLIQGKLTNLTIEERLAFNNKDKKNKLMHIDELHKFSDCTLNDVRTALDDHLKGIRMKYLPQTIWRQSDRDKAGAMTHAIDKQLKTRRIMRSLEKVVGGRPYEGDFWLLQRTI